jgi:hypothetical protein
MSTTTWIDKDHGPSEGLCPRCGGAAQYTYPRETQTQVQVTCPDCGSFNLAREEFDMAETDLSGAYETEY